MSIQNILVPNDYTIYCENLDVTDNIVAGNFASVSLNLNIVYSNGSRIVTNGAPFNFKFTNNNGMISVLIPFFDDTGATGNTGYYTIDLSSSPLLADYLPGANSYLPSLVNDGGNAVGNFSTNGNLIEISAGLGQGGLFSGAASQGIPFAQVFNYFN